jgi:ABC-type transport system involved in Fe-S cluster assembly fused permease/ATPase subunit
MFSPMARAPCSRQCLFGQTHEHASEEEKFTLIKEACIKANADGFVSKLSEGYDTFVGDRGQPVSDADSGTTLTKSEKKTS